MSELLQLDLEKMQTSLREIADERQASIEMRLRHYRARQQILSHRILKLVTTLESLTLTLTPNPPTSLPKP